MVYSKDLLCIQGFQGYGYSEDFVKNMIEIIENIDSNPEAQIITECDVICFYCPHNIERVCQKRLDSAQKVKDMDMRVLRKLNLRVGTIGRVKDFLSHANTKIRNSFDVHNICGECDWKEKCLWFISQNQ